MSNPPLIPDRHTECRILALLQCTHALTTETDRLAAIIAELLGIDPSDDAISEAVWNSESPATALMFLKGDLPHSGERGVQ
ncbi:MAG: hypothetical protein RIA08_09915 [Roseovarius sp.]|uniref:hypothetical protein n=1 Tax=Roseovarius sp. TaxID=1486281 RepID=UPI0032EF1847